MDDLKEEQVTDKKRSVSYSQYTKWMTCPQQWKLSYVDGHKQDSGINLVFGTAMHNVIQHWLGILYGEDKLKARVFDMTGMLKDELTELVQKELMPAEREALTTQKEVAEFYADGCNILEQFRQHYKEWFPPNRELVGVEIPLEKILDNGLLFRGYIDVVMYHKATKTYYIYDFKTSTRGWWHEKKDVNKTDQLLLYKKFYADLFGVPVDNIIVEFIILKRKLPEKSDYPLKHVTGFEPSHGKISMNRAEKRFQTFLNEAFDTDGNPHIEQKAIPSEKNCKWCPFNKDETMCSFSWYLPSNKKKVIRKG
jgi:hypothetical protein